MAGEPGCGSASRGPVGSPNSPGQGRCRHPTSAFKRTRPESPLLCSGHREQNGGGSEGLGTVPSLHTSSLGGVLPASSAGPDLRPRAVPACPSFSGRSQVWALYLDSWASAGLEIPIYSHGPLPGALAFSILCAVAFSPPYTCAAADSDRVSSGKYVPARISSLK